MIIRLLFIVLVWFGAFLAYDFSYQDLYEQVLAQLHATRSQIIPYAFLGSFGLVFCSFLLGQIRFFASLFLLARLFLEASQLAIYLLSFAAVAFWFDFGRNLWLDLGLLALVPFLVLSSSCISLLIFDFNYPLRNSIQRTLAVPVLSVAIIYIAGFFY
jgi:hypothetical protein